MPETKEIEFYVMVDQDGDFGIDTDRDNLPDRYREEISMEGLEASRVLHLKLTVQLPTPTVVQATIPDTDGPVSAIIS